MRYTPTLKLSTRLVAFVTMIVICAMFILFVGGTLSFKRLGQEYLTHYLEGIVEVVDKEMEDPDAAYSMQRWMPKMLQASSIVEMTLSTNNAVVYRFKDTSHKMDNAVLFEQEFRLTHNQDYVIYFKAIPPYLGYGYSMQALWSITLAVILIIFCLMRGVAWLKEQLSGSEMLEERGRMILAGRVEQYAKGDEREWPYTASEALDVLIEELQDARQERSRFDTFIRTQTFLDKLTGTANRVLFDSKLESALLESGASGAVLLVRIQDWKLVEEEQDKQTCDEFIVEVGGLLSNLVQRFPEVVFSRYYDADFALFLPHYAGKDVANLASQCIRQLEKLHPPYPLDAENWCHIGMTMYKEGERHSQIIDEAETALRSAQLQNSNNWSRFKKWNHDENVRGSVRWRTLFDSALTSENVIIYAQSAYLISDSAHKQTLHEELTCRIHDPENGIVKASRFISAVRQVGYEAQMDRAVINKFLNDFKGSIDRTQCYVLNLNVTPFRSREYFKWFRYELLQLSREQRQALIFEFVEAQFVKHLDFMRPAVRMLAGLECQIMIGQAGRTIVSTHYLKEVEIRYLKLHRSLVAKIDQRHENQLFVRSMLGAAANSKTKIIAVGIENKHELNTLVELGVHGGQGRYFSAEEQYLPRPQAKQSSHSESQVKLGRRNRWRK
ncbi:MULTISPECIES: RNase E specificity factor CsrD [Vibrio]|jgi:RNase E specificity factor CsrD|uniref:RNase E specificity factor CsrD n=1 Tax=Vibrio TaxID=662 RepID=UPI000BFFA46A|nr:MULTISPECIES: RNase E specificity factor CsrD [unclassified Vibrio]PHJ41078.1 diguanylate phosphodiesterase [Vibrio sp. PID17_43]RIZ52308.1 diguanylate phosphodiesterase [Vibrio sp. PID23_8]